MSQELQQVSDVGHDVVEWAPVSITVVGKTSKEKRLSVIDLGISYAAKAFLADQKGAVGERVRESMSHDGELAIARNAFNGNYKPLAEALAITLGVNITITSRRDYESMRWAFEHALGNLKNGGVASNGKETAAAKSLRKAHALVVNVQRQIEEFVRRRDAGREQPAPALEEAAEQE